MTGNVVVTSGRTESERLDWLSVLEFTSDAPIEIEEATILFVDSV